MSKRPPLLLITLIISAIFLFPVYSSPAAEQEEKNEEEKNLVIYAYDSFVSEWGPAGKVIPKFEQKYGISVTVISAGDAGQVLNRIILEKEHPKADIAVGIDNNMLARCLAEGVLVPYKSPNLAQIPTELIFDQSYHVTPFDYGFFAFIFDTQAALDPPESLEDLMDPNYRDRIIIEDARTSSPGLGFLLWTIAVYAEEYLDYWERLSPNLLTVTEGWDTAYGMFTSGEAPLVLSYTTSPAYHVEYEQTTRYRALIFKEGNYLQIEGMGIVRGCPHPEAARRFIDFILTDDFQHEIPLTNWMYPVSPDTETPASFEYAPRPEKRLALPADTILEKLDTWLRDWHNLLASVK